MTSFIIFINFILLLKMRWAIRIYRHNTLKSLTESAMSTKNDTTLSEQVETIFFSIFIYNYIDLFLAI